MVQFSTPTKVCFSTVWKLDYYIPYQVFRQINFEPFFGVAKSQLNHLPINIRMYVVSSDGKFLKFPHSDIWHFYDRKSYQTNHVFPTPSSRYTVIPNDMIIRSPLPHRKSQPQSSFLFRTFYAGAGCRLKLSHPKKPVFWLTSIDFKLWSTW